MRWNGRVANLTSLVTTRRQASTSSTTVQQKAPKGRRSVCYDREALEAREEHKPKDSATDMAAAMGIDILTEAPVQRSIAL